MKRIGRGAFLKIIPAAFFFLFISCSKDAGIVPFEEKAEAFYKTAEYDSSFKYYGLFLDSLLLTGSHLPPEKTILLGDLILKHAKYQLFDELFSTGISFGITDSADLCRLMGERYLQTDDPVKAESLFINAYLLRARTGDTSALCSSINDLANVNLTLNKFEKALGFLEESSELLSKGGIEGIPQAEYLSVLGNYNYRLGDYKKALMNYERSYRLFDSLNIMDGSVRALNSIGNSYFRLFRIEEAHEYFIKALELKMKLYGPEHPQTADTENNMGLIFDYYGEPDIAIDYYAKSLAVRENVFGPESRIVGKTLTNYANALKDFGDYARAESLYIKSIGIFEKINADDTDIAIVSINLGEVLAGQNKFDSAVQYLSRAVKLLTNSFGDKHIWVAIASMNLSISCWSSGRIKEAEENLAAAYKIAKATAGEDSPVAAQIFTEYGFRESSKKNYLKALGYYQKALNNLVPGFSSNNYYDNPDSSLLPTDIRVVRLLSAKADALIKLNGDNLTGAHQTLTLAEYITDNIRMGFKEESSGLLLGNEVRETFTAAIDVCCRIYEKTRDKKYITEAFRIFEKSKSAVLLSRIVDKHAKDAAGIPDSLLEMERQLKMQISSINISEGTTEKAHLLSLKQKYFDIVRIYEEQFPVYYKLKYNTEVITLDEMRSDLLSSGETYIHYFTAPENIYCIVSTKTESRFIRLPLDININETAAAYRKGMIESDYNFFVNSAYKLYSNLIQPVEKWIRGNSVIIVPDGILNLIAFDTLIDSLPSSGKGDYKKLNYLIYKYSISYTYSGSLLKENLKFRSIDDLEATLGFAPY